VELENGFELHLDALIRVKGDAGGQSIVEEGNIIGVPEFGAKITNGGRFSQRTIDLLQAGFLEFFEWASHASIGGGLHSSGKLRGHSSDKEGVLDSDLFPGLEIELSDYHECNVESAVSTVQETTDSCRHEQFSSLLANNLFHLYSEGII
jgi:hypothetical protein